VYQVPAFRDQFFCPAAFAARPPLGFSARAKCCLQTANCLGTLSEEHFSARPLLVPASTFGAFEIAVTSSGVCYPSRKGHDCGVVGLNKHQDVIIYAFVIQNWQVNTVMDYIKCPGELRAYDPSTYHCSFLDIVHAQCIWHYCARNAATHHRIHRCQRVHLERRPDTQRKSTSFSLDYLSDDATFSADRKVTF
jgi:hypothetical protein